MGTRFTDEYSLLHLACGIVVYYWNVSFIWWFIIHLLFEYAENTSTGMTLINRITLWPGGKDHADNYTNSLGDQFYASIGWLFADFVCNNVF